MARKDGILENDEGRGDFEITGECRGNWRGGGEYGRTERDEGTPGEQGEGGVDFEER